MRTLVPRLSEKQSYAQLNAQGSNVPLSRTIWFPFPSVTTFTQFKSQADLILQMMKS
ncbi:UNVERIFIED_CONTAM: hypothetical protein GTU68_064011 [Idotea baltica]|nr:hypothetical protein [Idotea baltica]